MSYFVACVNERLLITGGGIDGVKIAEKAWVFPWQKCRKVNLNSFKFEFTLQAMSTEKLQYELPLVFTMAPERDASSLVKYATLFTRESEHSNSSGKAPPLVQNIIRGVIEGETRAQLSQLSIDEVFRERHMFKEKVEENIKMAMKKFGLRVDNCSATELQDSHGMEYFMILSQKAHEGATNQAKVDVAHARMLGEIGEAEQLGKTKQELAKIDAQTAVLETKRKSEKATADAELTTTQTKLDMSIKLANIDATRQAEARDNELQRNNEVLRAQMELERLRATDLVQATIKKESAEQAAEAQLNSEKKGADGIRYRLQQDAEAKLFTDTKQAEGVLYTQRQDAEAAYFRAAKEAEASLFVERKQAEAMKVKAEANFFAMEKEAEALTEMAGAYRHIADVLGGPQGLLQYMMLKDNTFEKLANANATAINGLQPKITVWNTGEGAGSSNDATGAIRNIMQSLPPLLSTINDQTGISPPNWLAHMESNPSQALSRVDSTTTNGQAEVKCYLKN